MCICIVAQDKKKLLAPPLNRRECKFLLFYTTVVTFLLHWLICLHESISHIFY